MRGVDGFPRGLLVPRYAEAPLVMAANARNDSVDARARLPDVIEGALVGSEDREELHRNDGGRRQEVLDDGFVPDRPPRYPIEIADALRNRRLAELGFRHV